MTGYLAFRVVEARSDRKTHVEGVFATRDDSLLGEIRWFGRWRQYTFFPSPGTAFNPDCLREIAEHTAALTSGHRAERGAA